MSLFRKKKSRWNTKQDLAAPSRYYGDGGTIHNTDYLNVETIGDRVIAVWFRCQQLPFSQREVDLSRGLSSIAMSSELPRLTGVEVQDR